MKTLFLLLILGLPSFTFSQGECLVAYRSEHYVLNGTADTVWIAVDNRNQKGFPTNGPAEYVLAPGERTMVSSLEWAQEFRDPAQWYVFKVKPLGLTNLCDDKNWAFERLSKTDGEYNLTLKPTKEPDCTMDMNSLGGDVDHLSMPPEPALPEQQDEIYDFGDPDAQFPGGLDSLMRWIQSNVQYPAEAKEEGIMGKVYVSFVIEKDGAVSNIEIMRSPHKALSKEVIRLIRSMPQWTPGYMQGKKIRQRIRLPVMFYFD